MKKIHYACGKRYLPGYINIDAVCNPGASSPPDIIHAMEFDKLGLLRNQVPLADGCADEILSIHFLEHVFAWQAPACVGEWRRLLRPGGRLVLELPDLLKCARNLLKLVDAGGRPLQQMAMWGIFGDDTLRDPYMMHRCGWWPESLTAFLAERGFGDIRSEVPEWHRAGRDNRDMRIVAVRK